MNSFQYCSLSRSPIQHFSSFRQFVFFVPISKLQPRPNIRRLSFTSRHVTSYDGLPQHPLANLRSNPTNALYTWTPLCSHCYMATCFSSKGPSSERTDTFCEQGQQNACPDVNIWKSKLHWHQCTDMKWIKFTRYSKTPFIGLWLILTAHFIYRSGAIWLPCAVYAPLPTVSSTSVRHSQTIYIVLILSKLKCFCGLNAYCKLDQGVTHWPMRCRSSQKTHSELQKLWPTHQKGVTHSSVAPPLVQ